MIVPMLQFLFRASGSFVMRTLFAILVVSFLIFGIGDVLRNRSNGNDVAVVGDQHITSDQLDKAMEQQARQFGGRIDMATLKKVGYLDHVLSGMIDNTLLELAAHDEGFAVGNKQAIEEIQKIPVFQDEKTKVLDREKFERVLAANKINEAEFVAYLKRETATKLLIDSELSQMPPPSLLVDTSYKFQNETRRGEIIRLSTADVVAPQPSADQLNDYYHKHESEFTAPEYRDFSFLYVDPGAFADKITISPDELKQAFDARQADFKVPERRELSQVMFKDEAKAKAVAAAAQAAKSLAGGLKASGDATQPMDLGLMSKQDLPDILQGPIFSAPAGAVLDAVQSPLGWHVIMVKRIEAARPLSFDEAKQALESDLKAEKARDMVSKAAKQVDDQLAGGASLADAGKAAGLTPISVKGVDSKGKHADGTIVPELHSRTELLKAAFVADKGTAAQITQDGKDAAFAITVEQVTPPALRPLDEVKSKVIEGYLGEERVTLVKAKAADLIAKAKSGATFAALARDAGSIVVPVGPVLRSAKDKSIPPHVVATLFDLTQLGTIDQANAPEGPILVRLAEIIPATAQTADDRAVLEKTLQTQLQDDMIAEYENALRSIYPVKINQSVLDRMKTTN